jgi:hypothetical protein
VSQPDSHVCGPALTHRQWKPNAPNGKPITEYEVMPRDRDNRLSHMGWFCREAAYTVEDLRPGARWAFCVAARNAIGWSDPSPPSCVVEVESLPCPSPPCFLGAPGPGSLQLAWEPPDTPWLVEHYQLRLSVCRGGEGQGRVVGEKRVRDELYREPTAVVESLRAQSCYRFWVRAYCVLGWSPWSKESEEIWTKRRL